MLEELKKVKEALESATIGVDYSHIALAEPAKRNPVCASLRAWTGGSKRDSEKALALLSGVIERLEGSIDLNCWNDRAADVMQIMKSWPPNYPGYEKRQYSVSYMEQVYAVIADAKAALDVVRGSK